MYSGTSPHSAGIFQGHLGFFPLLQPYIKFVSKFSHISFFSISVAISWPRPLSYHAGLDSRVWAGLSAEACEAARRLSQQIRLQWTLVLCCLPLLGLCLPPYRFPSYVPPASSFQPAPHSSPFQAFSTSSLVPTLPPTPTSAFN